jgi:hypothetical protein
LFVAVKNGGKRKKRNGRREDRLSGHNLNIMDEFMDEYYRRVYFVGNTFCKNDIILAFFSHCNFSFIYNLFIKNKFPTIISCFKTIIPKNNYKKYACGSNFSKYVCVCEMKRVYFTVHDHCL